MDLLGSNICKDCFEEISTTPVFAEDYDYYKEIVKKILKNYIYKNVILNPVR